MNTNEERNNGEHLNKYKMFRNFMVNELGISREDIMLWTKEAVADEVKKIIGQFDMRQKIDREISSGIRSKFQQYDSRLFAEIVQSVVRESGYNVSIVKREGVV
jgi:hydrogenase maturation factor HypE